MEEQDIMNIWDIFLEYIPDKNRDVAATRYVAYLISCDTDMEILESILGNDDYLDSAIEEILEDHDSNLEDEDEDKDW